MAPQPGRHGSGHVPAEVSRSLRRVDAYRLQPGPWVRFSAGKPDQPDRCRVLIAGLDDGRAIGRPFRGFSKPSAGTARACLIMDALRCPDRGCPGDGAEAAPRTAGRRGRCRAADRPSVTHWGVKSQRCCGLGERLARPACPAPACKGEAALPGASPWQRPRAAAPRLAVTAAAAGRIRPARFRISPAARTAGSCARSARRPESRSGPDRKKCRAWTRFASP